MSLAAAFPSSFRRLTAFFPALLAGLLAALPALAQPVSVNDGFNPDVDGTVFTVVAQPDGKLLVGGQFTSVGGISRSNLARLNADGSVDTAFNPSPNAPVRAVLVQRDNRVVIGGDFTTVQPGATGAAVTRNRLARLNADGSVDTAFNPNLGGQLQPQVHALLLQADNRIVAGGSFTSVQPNGAAAATTRN
ncbi:MAG: delta-60 repeat domain-containing protein, partial [Opitutaceae bacterium]